MVLKMPRPVRHPKTGIFQFRQRVPERLVEIVGKREEKVSLGTRDPAEAKILHARVAAEVGERWRQLSVGAIHLSQKQAVAMAGEIYREMVHASEENPGDPRDWRFDLMFDHLHLRPETVKVIYVSKRTDITERVLHNIKNYRNDEAIKAYLKKRGYLVDEVSFQLLRTAVASAIMQAKEHLLQLSNGDYRPDPDADRFPQLEIDAVKPSSREAGKYSVLEVFEDYNNERKLAAASYKKWRAIIEKVSVERPDIRNISTEWVVDWKNRLIRDGLAPGHVKDSYLACLKSTLSWAKGNNLLSKNPVEGVTVAVPKKIKTREKFFNLEEIKLILTATLSESPARMSPEMRAARRWAPWLCAYTGARVGEITQLRKEDIVTDGGYHMIKITPEAGSTKNGNFRYVAIHPHLIEQGFLTFVRKAKPGPLFFDPSRHRGGTDGNPQYKKASERLARWIRQIGVDDVRINPNHAWRHLFKTKARSVFMDVGARDYMQGHMPATEGEAYGGFEAPFLFHEIAKIPRFEIG